MPLRQSDKQPDPSKCERCEGDGWIELWSADGLNMVPATCPECGGTGNANVYEVGEAEL